MDLETISRDRGLGQAGSTFFERQAKLEPTAAARQALVTICSPCTGSETRVVRAPCAKREGRALDTFINILRLDVSPVESCPNNPRFAARSDPVREIVVRVEDHKSFRWNRLSNDRFLRRDRFARFQVTDMRRADVGDDCSVRPSDFTKRRQFAGVIHSHFEYAEVICAARPENSQRQSDMVVIVPDRLDDGKSFPEHRGDHLFGAGFAAASGHTDRLQPKLISIRSGKSLQRSERLRHFDLGEPVQIGHSLHSPTLRLPPPP